MAFRRGILLAPFVVGVVAVQCYGPTEVTIDLSTDLTCAGDRPETWVFSGSGDATPNAKTTACTNGTGDAEIGTIAFVPSGDRDGRAEVKVVLARNGKSPSACAADPADCIVASRKFAFVPHDSQRLPIRLAKECIGTVCPAGQTCVAAGKCSSSEVTCSGASCGTPTDVPQDSGTTPAPDAGDAASPVDAGHPLCTAPGGGSILYELGGPPLSRTLVAASKTTLFWAEGNSVVGMAKTGDGGKRTVLTFDGSTSAIAADGESAAVAYVNSGAWYQHAGSLPISLTGATTANAAFVFGDHAWVATDVGTYAMVGDGATAVPSSNATDVAASKTTLYLAKGDGIYTSPFGGGALTKIAPDAGGGLGVATFVVNYMSPTDDIVGATGSVGGSNGRTVGLSPSKEETNFSPATSVVAIDDFYHYRIDGQQLYRKNFGTTGDSIVGYIHPQATVTALFTDYQHSAPLNGLPEPACFYLWEKKDDTHQQLEVLDKTQPQ